MRFCREGDAELGGGGVRKGGCGMGCGVGGCGMRKQLNILYLLHNPDCMRREVKGRVGPKFKHFKKSCAVVLEYVQFAKLADFCCTVRVYTIGYRPTGRTRSNVVCEES